MVINEMQSEEARQRKEKEQMADEMEESIPMMSAQRKGKRR